MAAIKSVDRAIDMLDCFTAEHPEFGVTELATRLSVHKSIASRMAATLRARRFLEMNPASRRYRIGRRVFELGQLFNQRSELADIAAPHLRALARSVGHASHIGVLDGRDVRIIGCVESNHPLQVAVHTGERRPVHATASGKLFLAFGPQDLFDTLSPGGRFPKVGPNTIEDPAGMKRELASIRRQGFARNREESLRGVGAVAAPVFDANGQIVASITAIYPLALVDPPDFKRICARVVETARKIGERLVPATNE